AIKQIEREKGISSEVLIVALEDALLAAYKKTPDAAEFARVQIDRENGEIRVLQLILPEGEELRVLPKPEPEEQPAAEAGEAGDFAPKAAPAAQEPAADGEEA